MELLVKNKLFTSSSKVLNEKDEQVYKVKGSFASNVFSKKYKKKIMTMNKELLYVVCNKRIHGPFKRAAIIYDANKKEIARVKQNGAFKCGYEIEGVEKKMEIVGSFTFGGGAQVMYGGKAIGKIVNGNLKKSTDKVVMTVGITDKYKITFDDKDDGPFLVAVIIAVDNIIDADKRRAANNYHSTSIN